MVRLYSREPGCGWNSDDIPCFLINCACAFLFQITFSSSQLRISLFQSFTRVPLVKSGLQFKNSFIEGLIVDLFQSLQHSFFAQTTRIWTPENISICKIYNLLGIYCMCLPLKLLNNWYQNQSEIMQVTWFLAEVVYFWFSLERFKAYARSKTVIAPTTLEL